MITSKHSLDNKLHGIKKDAQSLKDDLTGLAHQAVESGVDGVQAARELAADELAHLRSMGKRSLKDAETHIRKKPGQSMLVALAVGLVAGLFFARK